MIPTKKLLFRYKAPPGRPRAQNHKYSLRNIYGFALIVFVIFVIFLKIMFSLSKIHDSCENMILMRKSALFTRSQKTLEFTRFRQCFEVRIIIFTNFQENHTFSRKSHFLAKNHFFTRNMVFSHIQYFFANHLKLAKSCRTG